MAAAIFSGKGVNGFATFDMRNEVVLQKGEETGHRERITYSISAPGKKKVNNLI